MTAAELSRRPESGRWERKYTDAMFIAAIREKMPDTRAGTLARHLGCHPSLARMRLTQMAAAGTLRKISPCEGVTLYEVV